MQQSVIEQIKHRLPIADVLASYITLVPSGAQFKARCPFHTERTASFSVSPERGVYYCFGCGAKGDIFSFVQQFEGIDFKTALTMLAQRAGVVLNAHDAPAHATDVLFEAMEYATSLYQSYLEKKPEAVAYLEKRGLTKETIAQFRIGYAPQEWRTIAQSSRAQQALSVYERAGLIKKTEKGYYDRFRGRIVFPLRDSSGRVVAFSGRMFPDTPEGPKYLNSPETELFQKSHILFGFDTAKQHIKKHNFAILVEGQMDIVVSHQYGFKNTVATSGTAVSDHAAQETGSQLAVIARLTPHLFMAFDGDSAGEKALARAAMVALSLGMNPKVVALPQGVDPADFLLLHGADAWKALLQKSRHFIMHMLTLIRRDASSPHMIARGVREKIIPFLAKIPSPVERQMYVDMVAQDLGMPSSTFAEEISQYMAQQKQSVQTNETAPSPQKEAKEMISVAERFVAFMERYPQPNSESLYTRVADIVYNTHVFTLPTLSEDQKIKLFALIEEEYGTLDEAGQQLLVEEFLQQMSRTFFAELEVHYTAALREAVRTEDEDAIAVCSKTLQDIIGRRHI